MEYKLDFEFILSWIRHNIRKCDRKFDFWEFLIDSAERRSFLKDNHHVWITDNDEKSRRTLLRHPNQHLT
uniref:Uncharacterized protein n=1 Tax=Romanomermis culicivorax TaxID=13658 RepID=A0A915KCB9_ROMCU